MTDQAAGGLPDQGFDPETVVGWPADLAVRRLTAEGYGPVIVVNPDEINVPRTLELMPTRVRVAVRDGRVAALEFG
jgi:hypothetical protein